MDVIKNAAISMDDITTIQTDLLGLFTTYLEQVKITEIEDNLTEISNIYLEYLNSFIEDLTTLVGLGEPASPDMPMESADESVDNSVKIDNSGAVLSSKNVNALNDAKALIQSVLDGATKSNSVEKTEETKLVALSKTDLLNLVNEFKNKK